MKSERFVDWSASESDFNRSAEALLQRMWDGVPGCRAYVLDGRGGDEGIDIGVERHGVVFHIYQLKFFPEGMSGGFVKRRDQVKRSFLTAAARSGLEEWTLITPRNPTASERRYTLGLRGDRAIAINVWGASHLDQEAAKHPDLLGAFTRRPLVDAVRDMQLEAAALVRPDDLPERLGKLSDLANSRSLYWGMHIGSQPGMTTMTLVPKRPDAAEKEPLGIRFEASFGPEHGALHQRFEQVLSFGGSGGVDLPADVVGSLVMEGPEWFAKETSNVRVLLVPEVLAEGLPAELRIVSAEGYVRAAVPGTISALTRGVRGFTLEASFQQLALTLRSEDGVGASLTLSWLLAGLPASMARAVLLVYGLIRAGETAEVWVHGGRAATLRNPQQEFGQAELPQDCFDFVDDLTVLSREFGVEFTVPEDFTLMDRIDVRFVRHLVEGKASYSPRYASFYATLNDANPEVESEALRTERQAVFLRFENASIEVLGRRLPVGTLGAYHGSVRARDVDGGIGASEAGGGQGRRVAFDPTDDVPILLWLPDRWADADAPIRLTPWSIDGVTEKLALEALAT